jgi:hypothetical protein
VEDDKEHNANGSQQRICSEIASFITKQYNRLLTCSIIEFNSRVQILVYFQVHVYEKMINFTKDSLGDKIKRKELSQLTIQETKDLFNRHCNKKWDEQEPMKRYGIFYKYKTDGDTEKFLTLSEFIDIRCMEKYNDYIFGM